MNKIAPSRRWLLLLLAVVVALLAAQCGAAPAEEPAPAAATPAAEEAPVEAEPVEKAATEEVAEDNSQQVVQESEASQAKAETGITAVTDEPDVSTPRTKFGGEYRDVDTTDAVSFHPYLVSDATSRAYQGLVYSGGLITIDENTLEWEPYAAESYSVSEDGLTYTFKLRQDMKWSDGQPITAHDYKWTYDQVIDPKNEYPYLSQFDFVTSYEALDDYTIQMKIDELYCPALGQIDFVTPLPKHIWEKLDWSDPEKNPEINHPTVVSGPYKLAEWKRDQFALFETNENYWYHGRPNFDGYSIEIVPDQDIAYEKMKKGETDTGLITPENLEEAKQLDNVTVYEWWPAAATWTYIGLNMREGFPTHDVNLRHALNYAIDKDLLTEEVYQGNAKRMCSVYPETSWVYNPDVPCYDYDTDKAIAEFAEAGYTLKDDKMVDEKGEPLKLKLIYAHPSQTGELIAVAVQDYLAEIGIELEIQPLEWASFLEAKNAEESDWDMFIAAWNSTIEPHAMFLIWSEEGIPDLNGVAYINKDVEKLFGEAGGGAGTCDLDFRKQKYQEIQKIIAEDSPYIFLYYRKSWSGQNNRIMGIEPTLLGISWNQEDWYMEDKLE
jgi:peptide/nickel transport system substrate-binding protein